jgi:hypothetical protein
MYLPTLLIHKIIISKINKIKLLHNKMFLIVFVGNELMTDYRFRFYCPFFHSARILHKESLTNLHF